MLRTPEGEVHNLDRTIDVSKTSCRKKKKYTQQDCIIVPEWTEDAEQTKRAQYGEAEERRLGKREERSDKISKDQNRKPKTRLTVSFCKAISM